MSRDLTFYLKNAGVNVKIHIADWMEPFIVQDGEEYLSAKDCKETPELPSLYEIAIPKPMTRAQWAEALS